MPRLKKIELNPETALQELAELQCRRARMASEADAKIAQVKSDLARDLKPVEEQINALEKLLTNWLKQNKADFKNERSRFSIFGSWGWRKSERVKVSDRDGLFRFAIDNPEEAKDLVKTNVKPVLEAIKNRLKKGEPVPGCELVEKDAPFYDVDQAFMDKLMQEG